MRPPVKYVASFRLTSSNKRLTNLARALVFQIIFRDFHPERHEKLVCGLIVHWVKLMLHTVLTFYTQQVKH